MSELDKAIADLKRYSAMIGHSRSAEERISHERHAKEAEARLRACFVVPEEGTLSRPDVVRERWNFDTDDDGLLVCKNNHERSQGCHFERLHHQDAITVINELRSYVAELEARLAPPSPRGT